MTTKKFKPQNENVIPPSRREFIERLAAGLTYASVASAGFGASSAFGQSTSGSGKKPIVVFVTMWGGFDGLYAFAPRNDLPTSTPTGARALADFNYLKTRRPALIAAAERGTGKTNADRSKYLDLKADTAYQIHSHLPAIRQLFLNDELLIYMGTGFRNHASSSTVGADCENGVNDRSHFVQSAAISNGVYPSNLGSSTAGLIDKLAVRANPNPSSNQKIFAKVTANLTTPAFFKGAWPTASIAAIRDASFGGSHDARHDYGGALNRVFRKTATGFPLDPDLGEQATNTVVTANTLKTGLDGWTPQCGGQTSYQTHAYGKDMSQLAKLLVNDHRNAGLVQFAHVNAEGLNFDAHDKMENHYGPPGSPWFNVFRRFDEGLQEFVNTVKSEPGLWERICIVMISEFGRSIDQNSPLGAEHGRGGYCMIAGGRVTGGAFRDINMTLERQDTTVTDPAVAQSRSSDIAVRYDFRALLWEVLKQHRGLTDDVLGAVLNPAVGTVLPSGWRTACGTIISKTKVVKTNKIGC